MRFPMTGVRWKYISVFLAQFLFSGLAFASAAESDSTADEIIQDRASNRLFWMSTGKVAAPEKVSIGLMGLLVVQAGYVPVEFLQFNFSNTINIWSLSSGYWSVGTKLQPIGRLGFIRGVSIGADFGFYPEEESPFGTGKQLQTFTLAVSVGSKVFEAHLSAMQFVSSQVQRNRFLSMIVVGLSQELPRSSERGAKLMTEVWMMNDEERDGLKVTFLLVGFRTYGDIFNFEIAAMFVPLFSFGHGSGDSGELLISPVPYISFMWYL